MELRKIDFIKNKKGMGLNEMYPAIMTLVMIGILLGIGLLVLSEVSENIDNNDAQTAVNDTLEGIGNFADWIPVIVVVIAAAIILGLVLRSFGTGSRV